jgi:hypothetical protein
MTRPVALLLLCLAASTATADERPTQSTSGSFLLLPKSLFAISTSDKQVSVNFLRDVATEPWVYVFLIQAGIDKGKGDIFDGTQLGSSVAVTGEFRRRIGQLGDYAFLRPSIGAEEYKTFLASDPTPKQIKKEREDLASLSAGYVRYIGGSQRVGLTFGYQEGTNGSDLKSAEVRDVTSVDTGSGTREIVSSQQVKIGRLRKTYKSPLSIDMLEVGPWMDKDKSRFLSYGFFLRKDLRDPDSAWVPGVTIYLTNAETEEIAEKQKDGTTKLVKRSYKDPDHPSFGLSLAAKDGKIVASVSAGVKF